MRALVHIISFITLWSEVLSRIQEFKIGIKLCAQCCFQTGRCTGITLDADSLYCNLSIGGSLTRNDIALVKMHPMVWKDIPKLECDENEQLIKSKSRGAVCVPGHKKMSRPVTMSTTRRPSTTTASSTTEIKTSLSTAVSTTTALPTTVFTTAEVTTASTTTVLITSTTSELTTTLMSITTTLHIMAATTSTRLIDSAPDEEAKGGKCKTKGMHYAPKQKKCVKGCRKFGKTMSTYKGLGLDAHNDKRISGLKLEECIQKCVTLTEFTCKSFDYGKDVDFSFYPYICYLSKAGYFEVPPKERNNGKAWILGVRNCED